MPAISILDCFDNNFTVEHAKSLSPHYKNISYRCEDIFAHLFKELNNDIALRTLDLASLV
jgi:hypothetical protein